MKERVAEPGAFGGAHRSVAEIEREITNLVLLCVFDLAERAMTGRRVDRQRRLGHAAKQRSQDLRRWQFDPGDQAELGIAELTDYPRLRHPLL